MPAARSGASEVSLGWVSLNRAIASIDASAGFMFQSAREASSSTPRGTCRTRSSRPAAAAIANAVYEATGVRFRTVPLTPERVWRGIRDARAAAAAAVDAGAAPARTEGPR